MTGYCFAQSCDWTEQIKYPDGSIGCLSELPFAKDVIPEEKQTIIKYLERSQSNAIAISKSTDCKAVGVSSSRVRPANARFAEIQQRNLQVALDRCMNQGCDCEIVVIDSASKVDKRSLLSMSINADGQKLSESNSPTKQITVEKSPQENFSILERQKITNNPPSKEVIISEAKVKQELPVAKVTDEQIAALRRELEKEIRERLLTESVAKNLSESKSTPPQVYANRKALVIGNDAYQKISPLSNAREDARVIAESLTTFGYKVQLKLDVTEKQFKSELRNFKNNVQPGDEVAIFFAGHGVQIASTNYLLPIDIAGQNEEEIKDEAVALQRLLDDMHDKGAKFTLAMIDACRDNPFKGSGRSIGGTRGLAPTTAATGQMVVFSAGSGQQALDKLGPTDKSKNGLFTRIFVQEIQKTGVTVDRVVRNVRSKVVEMARSVGHNQVPAIYDQVVGEFYFRQ